MSGRSRWAPQAGWIVPVIVALIGAIGVVAAAVIPSLLASNGGPTTGPNHGQPPPPSHTREPPRSGVSIRDRSGFVAR